MPFWNREKGEEKRAREQQAQEEIDRLKGLAPEQLAAEILPVLVSDGLKSKLTGARVQEISKGMLDGFGSSMRVNPGVLLIPIREGLQRLEHANLVMQMASSNVDCLDPLADHQDRRRSVGLRRRRREARSKLSG